MWIWPLLFSLSVFSQDDVVSEQYCFLNPTAMAKAASEVKMILLPVDQMNREGLCFTISTKPHRIDLIQSYVKRVDPTVSISLSGSQKRSEPCRLKVEKEKTLQADETRFAVGGNLDAVSNQKSGTQFETMQLQTLGPFELKVDQDTFQGHCTFITSQHYVIKAKFKREAPPQLVPTVRPPDAQTFSLETTIDLRRGERIELGSLSRTSHDGQNKIDLTPQLESNSAQKNQNEKVFLSLE